MKKFLVLTCCLLLCSCFEITEKIKHHDNQSGEYSVTVDFSQSWFKTKSAMLLEEVDGVKIPSEQEITQKLLDFKRSASKIEGISNVITKTDFDNYVFTIRLDYQNLKALNSALNSINKQKNQVYFAADKNNFQRIASYSFPENLLKDPKKKPDLEQANVIAIYTFDRDVASVNNGNSKISKNKKTIFLKHNVYNVLKKSALMNNTIQLTP